MTGPRKAPKHALSFILVTILIDAIGLGIIVPVLPRLIEEVSGEGLSAAALIGGGLIFVYALMQFVFAPVIGNLSDRFGRRPVLIASLAALAGDYLIMAVAPTLIWLFIGRTLAGIAGATFTTANAYIADITDEDGRARAFGFIGAAWGVGFILGPVVGGLVGEAWGTRAPFFAAAAIAALNAVYGLLVLPETLEASVRRPFQLARANIGGAVRQLSAYPGVLGLLGALVFYQLAHDANPAIWSYYTMYKFGWSEGDVGLSIGFVGICTVVVMGWLTGVLVPKLGERRAIHLGFGLATLGLIGYAAATEGWMMYAFTIPFALVGIASATLRSLLSKQVPANAQGELQGAITSVMSLTAIAAPLLMTGLFFFATGETTPVHLPGAPYYLAALAMLTCLGLFIRFFPKLRAQGVEGEMAKEEAAAE